MSPRALRRALSLALALIIFSVQTPAAPLVLGDAASRVHGSLAFWLRTSPLVEAAQDFVSRQRRPRAEPQQTQEERDSRVARVELFPGDVRLRLGEQVTFAAVAFDENGTPVGGVKYWWGSSDERQHRRMQESGLGEFTATAPGAYRVTAEGAGRTASATVVVVGGEKAAGAGASDAAAAEGEGEGEAVTAQSNLLGDNYGWNDQNLRSAFDPGNERGEPMDSSDTDAGAGSGNFNFSVPVLSRPGRGRGADLSLVYNSRVWHKDKAHSEMIFNVDRDWPAPGWSLGFGKMVNATNGGAMIIEPDGTRHDFYQGSLQVTDAAGSIAFVGHTKDGSFIDYRCETTKQGGVFVSSRAVASYPDGTVIGYASAEPVDGTFILYPTTITDVNGNVTTVTYRNGVGPRISTVTDSLGRTVLFHYDANNLLTAVTAAGLPGDNGQVVTRTLVRLHYKTQPLSTGFAAGLAVKTRETSPVVIDAVFMPGLNTGYWFGDSDSYTSYGMLRKVVAQRGMSHSDPQNLTAQGTVFPGSMTRQTDYTFAAQPSGGYTDAPTFTASSETWQGMDVATPYVTNYLVEQQGTERKVTSTVANRLRRTQYSYNHSALADTDPDKFKDGLTYLEEVHDISTPTPKLIESSEIIEWDLGDYNSPRPRKIKTKDMAGREKVQELQYGPDFNQVEWLLEYGYDGVLVRKTHRTYKNESEYTLGGGIDQPIGTATVRPRVLNLIGQEEVFNGANARVGLAVFGYDTATPDNASGAPQHDARYNPYSGNPSWIVYRGNLTSVTRYADAAGATGPVTESRGYDMTGNVRRVSSSCCEEVSVEYTAATQYAYPTAATRGSSTPTSTLRVTTRATYDFNTGLTLTATDANGRVSQNKHNPSDWRLKTVFAPTGARAEHAYIDAELKNVKQSFSAAGVLSGESVTLLNGVGKPRRVETLSANGARDVAETRYDELGRLWKSTRPFRDGQGPRLIENVYDAFGRPWKVISADGSVTENIYDEATRPLGASATPGVTVRTRDAWGRERWTLTDFSGNLVEVAEAAPGGNGQVLNTAGVLISKYKYDALNRPTEIRQPGENGQPEQVRTFVYDGLGRMTHQKLAEKDATLNDAGQFVATFNGSNHFVGGQWSDVFAYDTRSNLVSHIDARGVKAKFSYDLPNTTQKDPLNRLQKVSYETTGVGGGQAPILAAQETTYTYKTKAAPSDAIDVTQVNQIATAGVNTETLLYDIEGRVRARTQAIGGRTNTMTTEYIYDTLGRLEKIIYPQQHGLSGAPTKTAEHAFDVAGRLTGLKVGGVDYASQMKYNEASQLTSLKVGPAGPNQTQESYLYDENTGLLTDQTVLRGPEAAAPVTLMHLSYDYLRPGTGAGRTGQITRITDRLNQARNRTFEYDAIGRLKKATGGADHWSQTYSYDRFGNRTATAVTGGTSSAAANPIDDARFFVRQHYLDFLSREPDAGGLNHWASQIEACGANASCVAVKRVDVSNAFFHSIEFQETGYYSHRFYRAALNRRPTFAELTGDMRTVGSGVIVGAPGWFEALEANKAAYAEAWVSRPAFAGYAGLTNAQYVDTLIGNTGVGYSSAERDGWVNALNAAAKSRGRVLREIVEDSDFANGPESNRAFIQMEYFGYLRRDPDEAGYNHWLGELNSGSTDRWNMVNAFISSIEYRDRFVQAGLPAQAAPRDGAESRGYESATNRITTAGHQYDAAGNLTRGLRPDGVWLRYQYDAAGRLAKVKDDADQTLETYAYGSDRRRLVARHGSETSHSHTIYVWGQGGVIAEYYETASAPLTPLWLKSYFYLGGRLLATTMPNGLGGEAVQHHHPDQLGTRLMTSPAGTGVNLQTAMPYGTAFTAEGVGGESNRRFTSYDRGAVTQLDYAVNRFYEPGQGRFTQPDPIGMGAVDLLNPQTLNLYNYCGGDPVNRTDPEGLSFLGSLFGAIGSVFGFLGTLFGGLFGPGIPNIAFNWNGRNVVSFSNGFKNIAIFGVPVFINGNFILSYFSPQGGGRGKGKGKPTPTPTPDPCANQILQRFELRDESNDGAPTKYPYIHHTVAAAFTNALNEINRAVEGGVGFTEVFRTTAHQTTLYNAYLEKQKEWDARTRLGKALRTPPMPAHRPGTSAHEVGVAFDLKGKYLTTTVIDIFARHGFVRSVPNDPVHFVWHGWENSFNEIEAGFIREAQAYYSNCLEGR